MNYPTAISLGKFPEADRGQSLSSALSEDTEIAWLGLPYERFAGNCLKRLESVEF